MNVAARPGGSAAGPGAPAIVDTWHRRDRTTTFAELEDAAARGAALLWQAGLRPGDAVLVVYPVSAELYGALIALFRLGLVAMFLDPSAGLDHIERCCALHPPQGLIGSPAERYGAAMSICCAWPRRRCGASHGRLSWERFGASQVRRCPGPCRGRVPYGAPRAIRSSRAVRRRPPC